MAKPIISFQVLQLENSYLARNRFVKVDTSAQSSYSSSTQHKYILLVLT